MEPQLIFLLLSITAFNLVPSTEASVWSWMVNEIKVLGDAAATALVKDVNCTQEELWNDVTFHIYTPLNPETAEAFYLNDTESFSSTNFNASLPTRILIHGWENSCNSSIVTETKDAFLTVGDFNIIAVDWSTYASENYMTARTKIVAIGEYVGEMIDFLVDQGMNIDGLLVMGHSMGAHIGGVACRSASSTVPVLIGCDPAGPLFKAGQPAARMNSTDAAVVQVIHSNAGLLGIDMDLGDSDFWPNGGQEQPGCSTDDYGACSHGRSWEYYAESIRLPSETFTSYACSSYDLYEDGSCSSANTSYLGGMNIDSTASGAYYLTTNNASTYCQG